MCNLIIPLFSLLSAKLDSPEKHLKTIQTSEIELVLSHIDPSAIVWLNLESPGQGDAAANATATPVLDLLQSRVLAHNYKEFELGGKRELLKCSAEKFFFSAQKFYLIGTILILF